MRRVASLLRVRLFAAVLPLALLPNGCGGGQDGQTIPPPTSPEPTPAAEPPPKPPAGVTGIEVAEVGQTFIRWIWEPVDGATSYEASVFPKDTPPSERQGRVYVDVPSLRADRLEPDTTWSLLVRAVRETAGGRAVGPWSDSAHAHTWGPWGEPRTCTAEREQARAYEAVLVDEWDGTPFLFYFSALKLFERDRSEAEHTFSVVERLSDRIEKQLGYSILEVGGWMHDDRVRFAAWDHDCPWRLPGQIIGMVVPESSPDYYKPGGYAVPACALWASMGTLGVRPDLGGEDGDVTHEIFHILGFKHHHDHDRGGEPGEGIGVPMSRRLSSGSLLPGGRAPEDLGRHLRRRGRAALHLLRGRLMGRWFAALLLAGGCGTGAPTGKPVAPPTSPEPAPEPEPPDKPRVRLSKIGPDYVEWAWDPVDGATSYEVSVAETPPDERTQDLTEEPLYRWKGLVPETEYAIWVRAIAETAGGRARGEWSGPVRGDYVAGQPESMHERDGSRDELRESYGDRVESGTAFPVQFRRSCAAAVWREPGTPGLVRDGDRGPDRKRGRRFRGAAGLSDLRGYSGCGWLRRHHDHGPIGR